MNAGRSSGRCNRQNDILAHLATRGHRRRHIAAGRYARRNHEVDLVLARELRSAACIRCRRSNSADSNRHVGTNWNRAGNIVVRSADAAQTGANNIAAAWEKITDQIGRDSQIKLYKSSLGM